MNKIFFLSTFYLLSVVGLNAQTWENNSLGDNFQIVSAYGLGCSDGESSPKIFITRHNGELDIYFANLETLCANYEMSIIFDNHRHYYLSRNLIEKNKTGLLFINGLWEATNGITDLYPLSLWHLLDEIRGSREMKIIYNDGCSENCVIYFKMDGSGTSIQSVFGKDIKDGINYWRLQKIADSMD